MPANPFDQFQGCSAIFDKQCSKLDIEPVEAYPLSLVLQ
jgi:hypothetical protein